MTHALTSVADAGTGVVVAVVDDDQLAGSGREILVCPAAQELLEELPAVRAGRDHDRHEVAPVLTHVPRRAHVPPMARPAVR